MLYVTTSWDDGDVLDTKLAEILSRYGAKGTFYITKQYRERRLSDEQIRVLAREHEIGAHTLTHPDLRTISTEKKIEEIEGSKKWLEQVLGREIQMFCYPFGLFDSETKEVVRSAGFAGARTTKFAALSPAVDAYEMPTTLAVYPMPFRKLDAKNYYWGKLFEPFMERAPQLMRMGVPLSAFRSFGVLARSTFDRAYQRGGVFHLWGHSWEIEKYGMWEELETVLAYISKRQEVQFVTNGELLTLKTK